MTKKIFILPKTPQLIRIRLKNPKTFKQCDYYCDGKNFYEINLRKNSYHSWFMNDSLIHDGNVYIITPIDPLFLIIPIINVQKQKTNNFCSLIDIMSEQNFHPTEIDLFNKIFNEKLLNCIADVKVFETELFIRFNREKTLKWCCLKHKQIRKSLAKYGYHNKSNTTTTTNGFAINNYKATSNDLISNDDNNYSSYDTMAIQILFDYINIDNEFINELCTVLCIKIDDNIDDNNQKNEIVHENQIKRKFDSSPEKFDNGKKAKIINNNKNNKKSKSSSLSRNKIAGIKDISSYFKKKQ